MARHLLSLSTGGRPLPGDHMFTAEARRIRILVVDDEPLVAGLMADVRATEGHEVDMARNGRQ